MPVRQRYNNGNVPILVWAEDVDQGVWNQMAEMANLPIVHDHIALMPDVHWGKGTSVGSVIPTKNAIIPSAVGCDIGCGMVAIQLNITTNELPDNLNPLVDLIENVVPIGFDWHKPEEAPTNAFYALKTSLDSILDKHNLNPKGGIERVACQLGTLGGGNHFIEVCLDEANNVWLMLHSGSRGIGNQIGTFFIEKAKEWQETKSDLAWLEEGDPFFDDYIDGMLWAQTYASVNRQVMMDRMLHALREHFLIHHGMDVQSTEKAINVHHNYASLIDYQGEPIWVTRKGAVSAQEGDLAIIPGSMGAKSYIVEGKGNPDSFYSCAHGAGRRMGRKEAKRNLSMDDLDQSMEGVAYRRRESVIDEAPDAYKDIDEVMANQEDLVEIKHTLKQVAVVKG